MRWHLKKKKKKKKKKGHQKKFRETREKGELRTMKGNFSTNNNFITCTVTGPFRVYTGTAHRLLKFLKAGKNFAKMGRKNRGKS